MEKIRFSASSINGFFQCPRQWYYKSINAPQIKVDTSAAEKGSKVHKMIEIYFEKISDNPTIDEIEKVANDLYLIHGENSIKNIWNNFKEFEKKRLKEWEIYKPTMIEGYLNLDDKLHGYVDFYGNNTIIDWKTGKYWMMSIDIIRQGNIYRYLLEETKGYKVDKILFVYLKENKVIEIPFKPKEWIENQINVIYKMIKENNFPKKPSSLCNWCPYKLICEYENTNWWSLKW